MWGHHLKSRDLSASKFRLISAETTANWWQRPTSKQLLRPTCQSVTDKPLLDCDHKHPGNTSQCKKKNIDKHIQQVGSQQNSNTWQVCQHASFKGSACVLTVLRGAQGCPGADCLPVRVWNHHSKRILCVWWQAPHVKGEGIWSVFHKPRSWTAQTKSTFSDTHMIRTCGARDSVWIYWGVTAQSENFREDRSHKTFGILSVGSMLT